MRTTRQRLTGWMTGLAVWLTADVAVFACPICFQFEESAVTDGVIVAVVVLVGVTTGVLGGFGTFIARFVKRSRRLNR